MGVYIRPESRYFWYWLEGTTPPIRRSTKILRTGITPAQAAENEKQAWIVYHDAMANRARQRLDLPDARADVTLRDWADWYHVHIVPGHTATTRARETAILAHLIRELGALDLRAIDRTTVQEYQATRLAAGVTSKTVNREVSVLKSLLREAVPRHLAVNPLYGMPNLKKGRTPRKRMVRAQEERRLLAALPPDVRDLYIIAVDTLIRQANAVHLHRRECRPAHLALEDSKTGPYTVPLSTRVRAILRRRIQARTGYLFPEWHERFLANQGGWSHELNRILRRAARAAGIATDGSDGRFSWHTATRATGATRMIRAGVDPRRVQLIGNWQSLDQMAEYLELDLSGGHDAVNRIAARRR